MKYEVTKTIRFQRLYNPFRLFIVTLLSSLHVLRQSEGKIRMKESQIFKIKIPPKQYLEGEGFVSAAEKFKQSLMNLGRGDLGSILSESSDEESKIINIATL